MVGGADELLRSDLAVQQVRWSGPAPEAALDAQVRIRYRHAPAAARVSPCPGGFNALFREPQRAISPGQAAVVYDGDRVLGGGYIAQEPELAPQQAWS